MKFVMSVLNEKIMSVDLTSDDYIVKLGEVEITEQQKNMIMNHPLGMGGFTYKNFMFFETTPANTILFDRAKNFNLDKIDSITGKVRSKFITTSPGQSEIYQAKYEEAIYYVNLVNSGATPDTSLFPFLQAECDVTSLGFLEAANYLISIRNQWIQVGAMLEKERLMTKKLIKNATTTEEMDYIMKNFEAFMDVAHIELGAV